MQAMKLDYLVRSASEIRRLDSTGRAIDRRGWAMGPFYDPDELPYSRHFEVKEWDANTVQRDWRNHEANGPEYISVTCGTLTVIGGCANDKQPSERERIEVGAGTTIVLRPGFLRRFECSSDACGLAVRAPAPSSAAALAELAGLYEAFTDHWKHTDQVRQLLLYNFLMAGTILVAGWGVLYASSPRPHTLVRLLSVMGVAMSALWVLVALRSTGYYDMYETQARERESTFASPEAWPFHRRQRFRHEARWWIRLPAVGITTGVPLLFMAFFAISCWFAFQPRAAPDSGCTTSGCSAPVGEPRGR